MRPSSPPLLCLLLVALTACPLPPATGGGGGGEGGAGGEGGEGGGAGSGGAGGVGGAGGAGGAGGVTDDCAGCAEAGGVCVGGRCEAGCPDARARCGGEAGDVCCEVGARCCEADSLGLPHDRCVPEDEPCPLPCSDGATACPIGTFCQAAFDGGPPACAESCEPARRCGFNGCCLEGTSCVDGACQRPNLTLDLAGLPGTLTFDQRDFPAGSCELAEGCIGGTGPRSLLRFEAAVVNTGPGAVELGAPGESRLLEPSTCGQTYVLANFLGWRLLDGTGAAVGEGTLDTRCVEDGDRVDPEAPFQRRFSCATSAGGLSAGWSDVQPDLEHCDFLDISGLPTGDYTLELTVNPRQRIPEESFEDNTAQIAVRIPDMSCQGTVCGGLCCDTNAPCMEGDVCAAPDLTIDVELLRTSVRLENANFPANDCAIAEGCLAAGGDRRLLRFSTSTPNIGPVDFFVGDPTMNPNASFSACHGHFHYHAYARYRLLDLQGQVVATGHKQAFCLIDVARADPNAGPGRYTCAFQGITAGWADIYDSSLDCQWVDVTGVPPGDYDLELEVNPDRLIHEARYDNNVAVARIHLDADPNACTPQAEICGDGLDQNCDRVPDDGCPPLTGIDTCATAHPVNGSASFVAELDASVAADVTPSCGGAGGEVFFRFEVLSPEIVYLSTYGSELDTVLAVYRDDCTAPDVACTDDGCGGLGSHWAGVVEPGVHYVAVKAKQAGQTGRVQLNVQRSGCIDALPIDGPGTYAGDTRGAGADVGTTCGRGSGEDRFYWLASCPGSTPLELSTCGAGFDSVLELRQGSCRSPGLACNDDGAACGQQQTASALQTTMTGEGLWFVVVDGFEQHSNGPYELVVTY